ncbi:Xaa-Pro peptidase family protein [Paenibacillus chondroitinus]|uniref:Xaa-Pro peptidase family protein n=1 Tax=Paenibacillus chondroitinus TaxID=59842 RepID=A0ABU6DN75_9BACL|nr:MULTISPECIES: Xaa-Pro peptidase family protein [Paenibacillus]MCY9656989.1 Xaa-Pro peptidase family protein [Paenibacillus anseongense]MEB4798785.1 Xaa-Pro peptidase family protein [Paenibacillus chondroitinus]
MQEKRIERLRKVMQEQNLPAVLITNAYNRTYVSGFTGSSGYVLITLDRAILLTDFRYMTQAPQQAKLFEVVEHQAKVMESVKGLLNQQGITQLAFEQGDVSYGDFLGYQAALPGIELLPTAKLVEGIRMVKDDVELQVMQEAADLADQTFSHILSYIKPGVKELDIALEIEMFIRKNGGTSTSFETIVASGERSALPHGKASDRVLQINEFVKLDFGAYYKGYCSDITRTVMLGKPTDKHKEIYDIVFEAQLNCLANLKPGITGREGDAYARDVIVKHGYGDYFGHSTGHGLGMEVHESPRLAKTEDTILTPGMVVTVEPGIYLPGFGGVRIEDDAVITDTGIKILTSSTKDFLIID